MAAVAKILSLLFLLFLSSPFHTQAKNTHLFNNFTQPKGDNQPQFEQAHTPEREEPVKTHNVQERKLDTTGSNDPTIHQQVSSGSSAHDPSHTYVAPDGSVIHTTESQSSQWSDVTTPNGYEHHSQGESSQSVTVTGNPSGYVTNSGNSVPSSSYSSYSEYNTNTQQNSNQQYYSSTPP